MPRRAARVSAVSSEASGTKYGVTARMRRCEVKQAETSSVWMVSSGQSVLRDDPATAKIPVLAISANAMPHDIKKGLDAGFCRYLTKPINVDEFMDALDLALKLAENGSDGAKSPGAL